MRLPRALLVLVVAGCGGGFVSEREPPTLDGCPIWAPDGSAVAFTRMQPRLTLAEPEPSLSPVPLYVAAVSGGGVRRVLDDIGEARVLGWTADSRGVVFAASELQLADVRGGQPGVPPEGSVFVAESRRFLVEQEGYFRPLDRRPAAPGALARRIRPIWSPDGSRFAFTAAGTWPDSRYQIYVVRADGSGRRAVTDNREDGFLSSPRWSPDGSRLVYSSGELHVVPADGGRARRITPAGNYADGCPAWSPNGRWIAFLRSWGGGFGHTGTAIVMLVRPDGSGRRRIPERF